MFDFIYFGIKIVLSSIIGASYNYIPNKSLDESKIIETSLMCILATSIMSTMMQFNSELEVVSFSIGVLAIIIATVFLTKKERFSNCILHYFSIVSGILIGCGFIFQSFFLTAFIYYLFNNSETLLNVFNGDKDEVNDNFIENITN